MAYETPGKRKFDGQTFIPIKTYDSKRDAVSLRKHQTESGWKSRVVKTRYGWTVYVKPRK